MTEKPTRILSDKEKTDRVGQIKATVQTVIEKFIQDHPEVIYLAENEDVGYWLDIYESSTYLWLSITQLIGVVQPESEEGTYEMVYPDQHGDLFSQLEPLVIQKIEDIGYKIDREGIRDNLKAQYFRVDLIN